MGKAILVRSGSTTVKIYTGEIRGHPNHVVAYYHGGHRVRRNFVDLAQAKLEAQAVANRLATGELQALTLRDEDKAVYTLALEALGPTGKRLDVAAAEYADALRQLAPKATLLEAVQFFNRHHVQSLPRRRVVEVVEELLETKRADGASKLYLKDLRLHLGQVADHFQGCIGEITAAELEDWLRALKLQTRSRNNIRNSTVTLFRFAKTRGYLPRDQATEADGLPKAKEHKPEVGILTPAQMAGLLAAAPPKLLPFLAIGGFAGLRHWELLRLKWEQINIAEGHILVTAESSKTAQRRIVPILPNLSSWLVPCRRVTGLICYSEQMTRPLQQLTERIGIEWPRNALRHSFGSYRLAQIQNAAQVSLEMGNSPQMIFRHYREVVTAKQAAAWFEITREGEIGLPAEMVKISVRTV